MHQGAFHMQLGPGVLILLGLGVHPHNFGCGEFLNVMLFREIKPCPRAPNIYTNTPNQTCRSQIL
jgi:hypothetical protein